MKKEIKVGVFATVTLVLLYFGFHYLRGINFFSSVKNYYVIYNDVDKLAVSNPVFLNGYAVGRVSDMSILSRNFSRVLVELEIESNLQLGDSTRALLASDFLGGKSVHLIQYPSTGFLNSKDTLVADREKGMFDTFSEKASPVADNLQTTLHKLSIVLDNLNGSTNEINRILTKFDKTPELINTTLITANSTLLNAGEQLTQTSSKLNDMFNSLTPTLTNVNVISDSLKQVKLNETIAHLNHALKEINITLKQINSDDNTIGKLLHNDETYNNLNRLLLRLDTLTKHLNENPKHFFAPLGKSSKKIEKEKRKS